MRQCIWFHKSQVKKERSFYVGSIHTTTDNDIDTLKLNYFFVNVLFIVHYFVTTCIFLDRTTGIMWQKKSS